MWPIIGLSRISSQKENISLKRIACSYEARVVFWLSVENLVTLCLKKEQPPTPPQKDLVGYKVDVSNENRINF